MTLITDAFDTVTDVGGDVADAIASPVPGVIKAVQVGVHAVGHVLPGVAFRTTSELVGTGHQQPGTDAHPAGSDSGVDLDFGIGHGHLYALTGSHGFGSGAAGGGLGAQVSFGQGASTPQATTEHTDHWAATDDNADALNQHHEVDDHDAWSTHHVDDVAHEPDHGIAAQQPGHEIPGVVT